LRPAYRAITGLRRGEAVGLRWAEIDVLGQCLRLESIKTGRSLRVIGRAAVQLLDAIPRSSEFVFPDPIGTKAAFLNQAIVELFNAAGLTDARSHDLRRTFASVAADMGFADSTIAALLGHAQHTVTIKHYVRRSDPSLIAAANAVAVAIASMLDACP